MLHFMLRSTAICGTPMTDFWCGGVDVDTDIILKLQKKVARTRCIKTGNYYKNNTL